MLRWWREDNLTHIWWPLTSGYWIGIILALVTTWLISVRRLSATHFPRGIWTLCWGTASCLAPVACRLYFTRMVSVVGQHGVQQHKQCMPLMAIFLLRGWLSSFTDGRGTRLPRNFRAQRLAMFLCPCFTKYLETSYELAKVENLQKVKIIPWPYSLQIDGKIGRSDDTPFLSDR